MMYGPSERYRHGSTLTHNRSRLSHGLGRTFFRIPRIDISIDRVLDYPVSIFIISPVIVRLSLALI